MKWISVEDKLPREYQTVLTHHKDDLFPVCAYMVIDIMESMWFREIEGPEDMYHDQSGRHGLLYRAPTHWMTLEELPNKQ